MTTITLNLPEETLRQVQQTAVLLQRPLEDLLSEMLTALLPDISDAPPHLQAELTRITWLNTNDLWQLARQQMPDDQQQEMTRLSQAQAERPLTPDEQEQLEALRVEYGRITLLKSRAYALLSLRGGKPLLAS